MKINSIQISQLPGVAPIAFVDLLQYKGVYVDVTEQNLDIQTATWNGVDGIPVFARIRDAYAYEFTCKNDVYQAIQSSRYAGSIIINLDNGTTHNAFITELTAENHDTTFFKKVTISYYDKDSIRFSNQFDFDNFPSLKKTLVTELKLQNLSSLDAVTPVSIDANSVWLFSRLEVSSEFLA